MNTMIIAEVVFVMALIIAVRVLVSRRVKGKVGEMMLSHLLKKLDPQVYRTLNDVYLPLPDGSTTQIDHVVVSPYGVFVIETKNYRGWIFGDRDSKVWTQSLQGRGGAVKNTFQNPIRQNYLHICALADMLGLPKDMLKTVVAFSGSATFKSERLPEVQYFGGVVDYIRSFRIPLLDVSRLDSVVSAIEGGEASVSSEQKAAHIENLKRRHAAVSDYDTGPKCPCCGAGMIRRIRKSDGRAFYGCSSYPRCKGVVNVD